MAVEPERSAHLGVHPVMLVELRRIFRKAGIGRFHVEAWSHAETAFGRGARPPFPDVAELFGPVGKLWILRRAWRRWA
jgi:hypothetical protein